MRITFTPLIVPLIAAAVCAVLVPIEVWGDLAAKLLPALSVVGAAVLVRLARGLVLPNSEGLEVEEARTMTAAIKIMVRKLRTLILVVLATMVALVVLPPSSLKIASALNLAPLYAQILAKGCSALIGLSLAYVFVRTIQVVAGDVGLVDIQADVFLKSLSRKQLVKFDEQRAASTVAPFKAPEGYGKKIS